MALSKEVHQARLRTLAEIEGYRHPRALAAAAIINSVCPENGTNEDRSHTRGMKPDEDRVRCDACSTNSMKPALVLAGVI